MQLTQGSHGHFQVTADNEAKERPCLTVLLGAALQPATEKVSGTLAPGGLGGFQPPVRRLPVLPSNPGKICLSHTVIPGRGGTCFA